MYKDVQSTFFFVGRGTQFWPIATAAAAVAPGRKPFGLIADFRIYARCLSDDEAAQLGLGRLFGVVYGAYGGYMMHHDACMHVG